MLSISSTIPAMIIERVAIFADLLELTGISKARHSKIFGRYKFYLNYENSLILNMYGNSNFTLDEPLKDMSLYICVASVTMITHPGSHIQCQQGVVSLWDDQSNHKYMTIYPWTITHGRAGG